MSTERLEYLRGELRAERISMSELAELQGLAGQIDSGDVELLEAAGVPEQPMRYEWSAFVIVEGNLTEAMAEEQVTNALDAINKGEGVRVYRDDSPPTIEEAE